MSDEPEFLDLEEVMEIHRGLLAKYGGSDGVRDLGLLQSALAMPRAGIGGQYFHSDLFEMAAAYLFHIVQNHPFIDGNKRVGAMVAFVFLRLHGQTLVASEPAYERLVRAVAGGKSSKPEVARFLRDHCESEAP